MASWPCLFLHCFHIALPKPVKLCQMSRLMQAEWKEGQIPSSPAKSPQLLCSRGSPAKVWFSIGGTPIASLPAWHPNPTHISPEGFADRHCTKPKICQAATRSKARRSEHKGRGRGIKAQGEGTFLWCPTQPVISCELGACWARCSITAPQDCVFSVECKMSQCSLCKFLSAFSSSSSAASGLNKFNFTPNGHLRNPPPRAMIYRLTYNIRCSFYKEAEQASLLSSFNGRLGADFQAEGTHSFPLPTASPRP